MILQPMQQQAELRMYLFEEGYTIEKDLLVKEGRRIYEILVVSLKFERKTQDSFHKNSLYGGEKTEQIAKNYPIAYEIYRNLQNELGYYLFENSKELVSIFLDQRIHQMEKIIHETGGAKSGGAIQMNQRAKEKVKKLKEVKRCL